LWRADRKVETPCLLDPSGDAGRAYGATCTPQFLVISPQGTLVYKGALSDWKPRRDGTGKAQYVTEAVAAAKQGTKPTQQETRAEGCSVKYWDPKWGERTAELRGSLAVGYPRPADVLGEPRWRYLRDRGASRRTIAGALREFARESSMTLVDKLERGEPLIVSGTIRDQRGEPVAGALVYVFHTDHRGLYSENGMDERNPRLFGYLRTGPDGRFEYRTIRPGHYPLDPNPDPNEGRGASGVEQHVHYEVSAPGFKDRAYRLSFLDDPLWKRTGLSPPRSAAEVKRTHGVSRCEHDITLERE
jgi:protocatechuate 3,4-dioxygenase beta subunit